MFYRSLFLLCGLLACRPRSPSPRQPALPAEVAALLQPVDTAPVIQAATVVAFWLDATDTLQGEGVEQLDDFHAYTALVAPGLASDSIDFLATTAESLVVVLEGGPTRRIMLAGLDFPFGYVLVEPGFPESILTGVSSDDELLDQVEWYFGLDDGSESEESPQVVGRPVPRGSGPALAAGTPGGQGIWRSALSTGAVCCRMASLVNPGTDRMHSTGGRSRSRRGRVWPVMPGVTMTGVMRSAAPTH